MIVTRIHLHCDEQGCSSYFPPDGALDGALYSTSDLRAVAYNQAGWRRRKTGHGLIDVCPNHPFKRKRSERRG